MPTAPRQWLVLWFVVALMGSGWVYISRIPPQQANPSSQLPAPRPGYPAPDFTLSTHDGQTLSLADLRGKPVVLNFWASWCGPCRAEMADFEAAWQRNGGEVVFVGVNAQEPAGTVVSYIEQVGVTYLIPLDPDGAVNNLYEVRGLPTTYFIDAQGIIQSLSLGSLNLPALEAYLSEIGVRR